MRFIYTNATKINFKRGKITLYINTTKTHYTKRHWQYEGNKNDGKLTKFN